MQSIRKDFPQLEKQVYLNTAAEGLPPTCVQHGLNRYFQDKSKGFDGREQHTQELDQLKSNVAKLYDYQPENIAVCSNSSEAFNWAAMALNLQEDDEVIVNDLEFPSGATPWLHKDNPATVKVWKSHNGFLDLADLESLLSPKVKLVSSSLVSFYNGYILPQQEVSSLIRKHSPAQFILDVTQALGRVPLTLTDVDLVISSTHKWLLGSHGGCFIGVPSGKENIWTVPSGGWYNQKDAFSSDRFSRPSESLLGAASFMPGMPNFPAIYALQEASNYILNLSMEQVSKSADPLVKRCLEALLEMPLEVISPTDPSALAGILAFSHKQSEEIYNALRKENICVMHQAGRIRTSWHFYNNQDDLNTFLSCLDKILKSLSD